MRSGFPNGDTAPVRWRLVLAAAVGCYAFVLILPHVAATHTPLARTFNSMLDHLLQGRFDVDPATVGGEGFTRAGRTYAYWGILPALLRLPVAVLPGWRHLDFTTAYCLLALALMAAVKLWTVRFVARHHPAIPRPLVRATMLVVVLAGAQTSFLRFSLYQEVCLWAGLCGAVFVAAAIVALQRGADRTPRAVMAAAAGAALLTRVSTAVGLVAAFAALLLVELAGNRADWRGQFRRSLLPLGILVVALGVTAAVNYGRWGDPLTFADYRYYNLNPDYPDRMARTAAYGLFNPQRIPFGLGYYFAPVWALHGGDGQLYLSAVRDRLIDSAELPPSSFLLTDPLLLLLAGTALAGWVGRRRPGARQGMAMAAGLALSPLLMLTAISMCHRYRIEFYPLLEFLAFAGLAMARRTGPASRPRLVWTLAAISILCSIAVGMLYAAGRLGPGQLLIGHGLVPYYRGQLGLD